MLNSLRKISALMFVMLALLLLFSCGDKSENVEAKKKLEAQKQLLTKKWVYQHMIAGTDTATGEDLGYPTMEFIADSTYKLDFPDANEQGIWRLEKEKIAIKLNNGSEERFLEIKELSDQKTVIYSPEKNLTITLVPSK